MRVYAVARNRVENHFRSRVARWNREQLDAVAGTSQFADHLARAHLPRLHTDREAAFLVPHAIVGVFQIRRHSWWANRGDRLGVSEARYGAVIEDGRMDGLWP